SAGLSTSSGNSSPSNPAARECTHCTLGAIFQICCTSFRLPDQLKRTCASGASLSNASTRSPTAIEVGPGRVSSIANCRSVGSERTKTVILSMRRKQKLYHVRSLTGSFEGSGAGRNRVGAHDGDG